MLGAALYIKNEVECYRASNNWGTTFWQYNEVWPTGGWGSVEYGSPGIPGSILGGRWKILHYFLRRSVYRNVMSTCNRQGQCYVRNDGNAPLAGELSVSLVHFATGAVTAVGTQKVELPPGAGQISWHCAATSTGSAVAAAAAGSKEYPVLYGMLPADRSHYSSRVATGKPSDPLALCRAKCDADAKCSGFTVTPTFENPTSCWLYPSVTAVVYGTAQVLQVGFYHKPAWTLAKNYYSFLAGMAPPATAKYAMAPIPARSLAQCSAACDLVTDCVGFSLPGSTPNAPTGNCSFFAGPIGSLVAAGARLPWAQRPSYFLRPAELVPTLPSLQPPPPPPPPKPPPSFPRPAGPSCETIESVQNRSGCTNETCMLVVEVLAPTAAMVGAGGGSHTENGGEGRVRNELLLGPPARLALPPAQLTFEIGVPKASAVGVPVTVSSSATALFVTLTTQAAGRFSDNAFLLLPSKNMTVSFLPWGKLDEETLRATLRVEHLQEYSLPALKTEDAGGRHLPSELGPRA